MTASASDILTSAPVKASAPCRVDMGGTLDIAPFFYPLAHLSPLTVNIALNLRTTVSLEPYRQGHVKVSSKGFDMAEAAMDELPLDHPLGLMFAVAAYFHVDGLHIRIASQSPPESALGGSSVAAVALIGAYQALFTRMGRPTVPHSRIALLARDIEAITAGVPCGFQDQLAAVYGGVHAWHWKGAADEAGFQKEMLIPESRHSALDKSVLLAYCGIPHASKNINGQWVSQFLSGRFHPEWKAIAECSRAFAAALQSLDWPEAAYWMNREADVRIRLTPDVLDETGKQLVSAARERGCGARFCGAGGGGCIWAIGESGPVSNVKDEWQAILEKTADGRLLEAAIDAEGLLMEG
ncbi:MAG: galactokinase [Thermodesulfobacteriota bacterium]